MELNEILSQLNAGGVAAGIAILLSLVQLSPIKLNPWDRILGWIGKKVNGETEKRLDKLEKQITDMWINQHRQSILTFARECRADIGHSSDEWSHILTLAADYEAHCERNSISNGVVRADTEYIRSLYQELSREHKI